MQQLYSTMSYWPNMIYLLSTAIVAVITDFVITDFTQSYRATVKCADCDCCKV